MVQLTCSAGQGAFGICLLLHAHLYKLLQRHIKHIFRAWPQTAAFCHAAHISFVSLLLKARAWLVTKSLTVLRDRAWLLLVMAHCCAGYVAVQLIE